MCSDGSRSMSQRKEEFPMCFKLWGRSHQLMMMLSGREVRNRIQFLRILFRRVRKAFDMYQLVWHHATPNQKLESDGLERFDWIELDSSCQKRRNVVTFALTSYMDLFLLPMKIGESPDSINVILIHIRQKYPDNGLINSFQFIDVSFLFI
jgi:hypothetical protein